MLISITVFFSSSKIKTRAKRINLTKLFWVERFLFFFSNQTLTLLWVMLSIQTIIKVECWNLMCDVFLLSCNASEPWYDDSFRRWWLFTQFILYLYSTIYVLLHLSHNFDPELKFNAPSVAFDGHGRFIRVTIVAWYG